MMSHTPGPWRVRRNRVTLSVLDQRGHYITENVRTHTNQEANARLIAAAPDLYIALKQILQSHDASCKGEDCPIVGVDLARAAIAKAEGR